MTKTERESLFDYKIKVVEEKISALDSKVDANNSNSDAKMNRILQKLDDLPGKFVTKDEYADSKEKIANLESALETERKRTDSINLKIASWG